MYQIRDGEITEYKADRMPVSYYVEVERPYSSHIVTIEPGDTVYIFSDGYPDQFGGQGGKKLKYKPLKELLLSVQGESLYIQKQLLEKHFKEWKGSLDQIDDVIFIGVRF